MNERRAVWSAILILALVLCVTLLTGCGTTRTKVVYEKVEVPKPFWEPPVVKDAPVEPNYQAGHVTPEEAESDPTTALVTVGQDLDLCLGDNELLRHMYDELLKLIRDPPPVPADDPE